MGALEQRLDLNDSQRRRAEALIAAQRDDYRRAVERCRPRLRTLRHELADQLGEVLDDAQRRELERMVEEADALR